MVLPLPQGKTSLCPAVRRRWTAAVTIAFRAPARENTHSLRSRFRV